MFACGIDASLEREALRLGALQMPGERIAHTVFDFSNGKPCAQSARDVDVRKSRIHPRRGAPDRHVRCQSDVVPLQKINGHPNRAWRRSWLRLRLGAADARHY